MRRFHFVVAIAMSCALASSACGGSMKPAQSVAAEKTPWLSMLIDESTDSQFRIRPQDAMKDPVFGPIMEQAEQRAAPLMMMVPIARTAYDTFKASSLVIIATRNTDPADAIFIFEGVPESLSPDTLTDSSGPLFKKIEGTPAGVTEYDKNKGDDGSMHSPLALHLAVVHQMWVVGLGPAADRLDAAVKSGNMDELHEGSGSLVGITAVGNLVEKAKKDPPPQIQPFVNDLSRVDMDVEGGATTHLKIAMTYGDEGAATSAKDALQNLLELAKKQKPELKAAIDGMGLARDKTTVTIDAPLPPDFLQAVMQHPHDAGGESDGPSDGPPKKTHPKKPKH